MLTMVGSIPLIAFPGMLSFSWLVGIGPKLEATSTWVLDIMTWLGAFVSEVSWAVVAWFSLPLAVGIATGFIVWGTLIAPRILSSRATMVYVDSRDHELNPQAIDLWMRSPDKSLQERRRTIYAGAFIRDFLLKLVASAVAGLFAGGLVIGVTAVANLTSSGMWGSVAFVVAAIIVAFAYEFIKSIPQMVLTERLSQPSPNPDSTQ